VNTQTVLLGMMLSGFFGLACIRATGLASPASKKSWTTLLRFPGRIERLRQSRWQWFAMVSFMLVLRAQQQLPLSLELMAAFQLVVFLLLPARSTEARSDAAAA